MQVNYMVIFNSVFRGYCLKKRGMNLCFHDTFWRELTKLKHAQTNRSNRLTRNQFWMNRFQDSNDNYKNENLKFTLKKTNLHAYCTQLGNPNYRIFKKRVDIWIFVESHLAEVFCWLENPSLWKMIFRDMDFPQRNTSARRLPIKVQIWLNHIEFCYREFP